MRCSRAVGSTRCLLALLYRLRLLRLDCPVHAAAAVPALACGYWLSNPCRCQHWLRTTDCCAVRHARLMAALSGCAGPTHAGRTSASWAAHLLAARLEAGQVAAHLPASLLVSGLVCHGGVPDVLVASARVLHSPHVRGCSMVVAARELSGQADAWCSLAVWSSTTRTNRERDGHPPASVLACNGRAALLHFAPRGLVYGLIAGAALAMAICIQAAAAPAAALQLLQSPSVRGECAACLARQHTTPAAAAAPAYDHAAAHVYVHSGLMCSSLYMHPAPAPDPALYAACCASYLSYTVLDQYLLLPLLLQLLLACLTNPCGSATHVAASCR